MKKEMAEFLLKRIGTKLDDIRHAEDERILEILADDAETYLGLLKDIVRETLLP